jgi:hypothetical protein
MRQDGLDMPLPSSFTEWIYWIIAADDIGLARRCAFPSTPAGSDVRFQAVAKCIEHKPYSLHRCELLVHGNPDAQLESDQIRLPTPAALPLITRRQ